jgi:hypothetical protein
MEATRRDYCLDGAKRVDLGFELLIERHWRVHEKPAIVQAHDRHARAGLETPKP